MHKIGLESSHKERGSLLRNFSSLLLLPGKQWLLLLKHCLRHRWRHCLHQKTHKTLKQSIGLMGWSGGAACPCVAAMFWRKETATTVFCKESNTFHLQKWGSISSVTPKTLSQKRHIKWWWEAQFHRDLIEAIKVLQKRIWTLTDMEDAVHRHQQETGNDMESWDTGHIVKAWWKHQRTVWNVDKVQPSV